MCVHTFVDSTVKLWNKTKIAENVLNTAKWKDGSCVAFYIQDMQIDRITEGKISQPIGKTSTEVGVWLLDVKE